MVGTKLVGNSIIFNEVHSGRFGSKYYYIMVESELAHVGELFPGELTDRGSRKRQYRYEIPLRLLRNKFTGNVKFYEFNFTNSGFGPFVKIYTIELAKPKICSREAKFEEVPDFRITQEIENWLDKYDGLVFDMIRSVMNIVKSLGIDLGIDSMTSPSLRDCYDDPELTKKKCLIIPTTKGRIGALREIIKSAHELYTLMLVAKALNGRTVPIYGNKRIWIIKHAQDFPTAVVESAGKRYTIWYQFSIKRWAHVVFSGALAASLDPSELRRLAMRGKFDELAKIFGKKPRSASEAYSMIAKLRNFGRQYVKPDITIFEGEYRSRSQLERDPPRKIVLIDSKLEISDNDITQLRQYMELFKNAGKIYYIVALLGESERRSELESLGYIVVENVAPNREGEKEFVDVIKNILK